MKKTERMKKKLDDEDEVPAIKVSSKEEKKCVEQLRLFFMQYSNEESPNEA